MTVYNHTKDFEKQCMPLLEEVQRFCEVYNIPFMFSACTRNDEAQSEYVSLGIGTGSIGVELFDDRIKRHLLVQTGFDVIPHRNELELQMLDPDADPDDI